jgi:beta-glucosidase
MKRLIAIFATILLVLSLTAITAFAEEAPPDGAMPTDGAVPTDGEVPPDGAAPTDGAAPEGMDFTDEDGNPIAMPGFGEAAGWEEITTDVPDTAETFRTVLIVVTIVFAVLALAALIGAIFAFKRKKPRTASKGKKIALNSAIAVGMVVCLGIVTVGNYIATTKYYHSIDAVFTKSTKTDSDIDTSTEDWKNLIYDVSAEGLVLLKNDNSALPLETTKINLLGYRAYDPVYSGSGSGSISAENGISIIQSLEASGFEINSAPQDEKVYVMVEEEAEGLGFSSAAGTMTIDEVSVDKFTGTASFDSMKAYSDVAVVVIGRTGGEGADLVSSEGNENAWASTTTEEGKTYLQLSTDEENLLKKARETFGTVIVLYNSDNAMELGYLEEYGIDAALWVGIPGQFGFYAIGGILAGTINPSGKLVDTYVYDLNSNPVQENFGSQAATNTDGHYVDYVEGIYLGYKWYETAFAENAVITNTKTGTTYDYSDYDNIVQYPFGYGLSYTTFAHDIVNAPTTIDPNGEISIDVTVTNTGNVAGKDAVEIYVTAPYTDYDKQNYIEKAAVSLAGYGKTKDIAPGASETVTVTFAAESIASYDNTYDNGDGTKGAYMLDAGDYVFSARSDSHNVYEEATATLSSQYFYSGDDQRDSDDQAAYNQFDQASRGIYLSRQDGFANYAEAMNSVSSDVKDTTFDNDFNAYDPAYDAIVTKEYVDGVDYNVPGDLTVADMVGLDYDDPQWDELIKQMSIDDILTLTSGFNGLDAVDSVGKPKITDTDGPLGISSMYNTAQNSVAFMSVPVLASTFNNELARRYGNYVADQAHSLGVTGWYAPAMNTHRSSYSGRNFEYYSEDATLAAGMAGSETLGAREKGLVVYIKHFAFNDQETHRSGQLHTYMSEQTAREIYLKPFEAAVKVGGATGVMTAMNYIGDVYVSASDELITQVLRNEWGFNGTVLTDATEGAYMTESANRDIRAGTDSWLAMGSLALTTESNADIYYLQRLAKNSLYMTANAQVIKADMVNWRGFLYGIDAALIILFLAGACVLFIRSRKPKTSIEVSE